MVDPKVAAINIVSQLDRQQANQNAGFGGPIKKPLGPAETGSLKKHKEILNTKYQNRQSNNLTSGFNFCDFDSSDSSLGSYEDLSLRPADQSNTTTPSTHPLNNQSEPGTVGIRSHSVGKPYNPDPKKSLNHDKNLGYKNSGHSGLSSATSGVYQSEYDSSDSQPKLIRRASGSDTNPYPVPTHAPGITGPTNTGPLDDNGFAILKSGGQMSDNMTSGNSKIDLSYSGSNLGSNIGSNMGSNVNTGSNQSNSGITKRSSSIVSSNNVRKIANNFEPVESPRKLNRSNSHFDVLFLTADFQM